MKRLLWLAVVVLLALDWAALDDITTGREPSFLGEYLTLALSVPVIVFLLRAARKQKQEFR